MTRDARSFGADRVGRYEIERVLGEGATGCVFVARDPVLGRSVAVKILRGDPALSAEDVARLADRVRHEARAIAALSHPGIVILHDMGDAPCAGSPADPPMPYLVFELVPGGSLRERIDRGAIATGEAAALARALGSALTHAHAAGVVHCDVKPENVILGPAGPKLIDFGLARAAAVAGSTTPIAPAYAAPEALRSGAFGAASDQFSLAVTLYEALVGRRPFTGADAAEIAERVASAKHVAPSRARPELGAYARLDAIFDRALAKDARLRFASCEAFGAALAAELEGLDAALASPATSRSSIVPRATRRRQNLIAGAAVLVIFTLLLIGREEHERQDGAAGASAAGAVSAPTASTATSTMGVVPRVAPAAALDGSGGRGGD